MKYVVFLAALSAGLQGAVITVHSGGITLNSYDTTTPGTAADPYLISEDMKSAGILELSRAPLGSFNTTGSGHSYGKWFAKTVLNASLDVWTSFEIEVRTDPGLPSSNFDGLSFAQGGGLVFSSNRFGTITRIEDVRDYLNFSNGTVAPGESVTFHFAVTDGAVRTFYPTFPF